jgi:Fe-S-cluster-containing dehydrogenase component/formate-dependent nitrite reductase membrane component NrfD
LLFIGSMARWAKLIDQTRCIGCHACTTACKSENAVPLSVTRTFVKYVDIGVFPQARRAFQVTRCNQCGDPPCAAACPTQAMYRRNDGLVDFDKSRCIGCKACMAACPYDAIFINPDDHSAEKCNFCAHRLELGLEPACVVVCPTSAILVGDLSDRNSAVARIVQREAVEVRRPEKGTRPGLFYRGAHQATLDPLAAARPAGDLFLWAERLAGSSMVAGGHASPGSGEVSAMLAYDVPHRAPWDWRVSAYTWAKGIAAGAYLVPALLVLAGWLAPESVLWQWVTPVIAGAFLALTGVFLILDLEHPERFHYIFKYPHWRSWLVRGGLIISAYGALLVLHFGATVLGWSAWHASLMPAGILLAILTAVYTAYLFAQSKGRDLWQSPLLPVHFAVQAVLAGSAALAPLAAWLQPDASGVLLWTILTSGLTHAALVAVETTIAHATAHAAQAAHEMTGGRYARLFWSSLVLVSAAVTAPWFGAAAGLAALAGLALYEHAYVQAGQSVPLA